MFDFNKLGIIALPRTGSSSLYYYFCALYPGYRRSFEPMNKRVNKDPSTPSIDDLITRDNVIIKHLIPQELSIAKNTITNEYVVGKPTVSKTIISTFDKVILLSRKNKIKLTESLYHANETNTWFAKYDGSYISNVYDKFDFHGPLMEADKHISLLSIEFNIPIFYYEDVFSSVDEFKKLLNYVNLPFNEALYNQYIHPSNKYRQDDTI